MFVFLLHLRDCEVYQLTVTFELQISQKNPNRALYCCYLLFINVYFSTIINK